ncbi:MAG: CaiB/BaiF CoA-transferase family protein [Rubrivivax sp.]
MGVLEGVTVVEVAALGPAPLCGSMLADLGAEVIVVERPADDVGHPRPAEIWHRGKRSIVLDLKKPGATEVVLRLLDGADALIEGMRPGVAERLGFGPEVCLARRPSLVYGRMTGWGQHGPLSQAAGHDGNYIGVSGALSMAVPPRRRPEPPPGLFGDVAGGALYFAIGLLAGVLRARRDGLGQVVDAAMADGSAHLINLLLSIASAGDGFAAARPGSDARHFSRSYRCADDRWINLCAVEPKFHAELLKRLGLDKDESFANGFDDPASWAPLSRRLERLFAGKTSREWSALLEGTDACFAPVLTLLEAAGHPHNAARGVYATLDGIVQAAAAPRFLSTPSPPMARVPARGQHTRRVLAGLGLTNGEIERLANAGTLGTALTPAPVC